MCANERAQGESGRESPDEKTESTELKEKSPKKRLRESGASADKKIRMVTHDNSR